MIRTTLLALLLATVAGAAYWHVWQPQLQTQSLPATAASAPEIATPIATAEPDSEEVDAADTETTLERILPRRSAGHAAGLHKVDDALNLDSSVALVIDAKSRKVAFSKNESAVLPIASLTKLMTGLVIAESGLAMDTLLTITEDDVDTERHSRSRLKVGTILSRSEALRLALMSSENRAAHALARTHPSGLTAFIGMMNAKARALGMTQTTYVDPTGLSELNQSSAQDLATLTIVASRHERLGDYSTTAQYRTDVGGKRPLQYVNSNRLVRNGNWDIELQKTGYIIEAGHCAVMRTRIAKRDWIMVLLDAGGNASRSADAERIRRWIDPGYQTPKVQAKALTKIKPRATTKTKARPEQRVRRSFSRAQVRKQAK